MRTRLYLKQLQTDFHALQVRPTDPTILPTLTTKPYSRLTIAVSLFGSTVLSGTAYSPFQQMFQDSGPESNGKSGGVARLWQRLVRR